MAPPRQNVFVGSKRELETERRESDFFKSAFNLLDLGRCLGCLGWGCCLEFLKGFVFQVLGFLGVFAFVFQVLGFLGVFAFVFQVLGFLGVFAFVF